MFTKCLRGARAAPGQCIQFSTSEGCAAAIEKPARRWTYELRLARVQNARAIPELHVRARQLAYRGLFPDSFLSTLGATLDRRVEMHGHLLADATANNRMWVAERDGRIVGFAMTGPSRDEDASDDVAELATHQP